MTQDESDRIISLYRDGLSYADICKEVGQSIRTIRRLVRKSVYYTPRNGIVNVINIDEQLLRKTYNECNCDRELVANRLGLPIKDVKYNLRKYKICPLTCEVTKEQLTKMYLIDGLSGKQIAKLLGFNDCTIYRKLGAYGLIKPSEYIPIQQQLSNREQIEWEFSDGGITSRKMLAEKYGVSTRYVDDLFKKLGIQDLYRAYSVS